MPKSFQDQELVSFILFKGMQILAYLWLSGKDSACQCRRCGFNPWVGKIPWRRKWQLTPVFFSGKSHGERSLVDYSPWNCRVRHNLGTKQQQQQCHIASVTFSGFVWISKFFPGPGSLDCLLFSMGLTPKRESPITFPVVGISTLFLSHTLTPRLRFLMYQNGTQCIGQATLFPSCLMLHKCIRSANWSP